MAVPSVLRVQPATASARPHRPVLELLAAVVRRIADSPLDNTVWQALGAPAADRTAPPLAPGPADRPPTTPVRPPSP
ncbi:hypothetical protein KCMC57_up14360 [Kitasatospora sp. CMC57]|uniref:Uncharacterized protein n=1 Tax=Kitasatospora sp. CMC57 TaxID=3231513 RepID=A0AB33JUU7_9ACTN